MPANFHVLLLATGAVVHAAPVRPQDTTFLLQSRNYDARSKILHTGEKAPQASQSSKSCDDALLEVDVKKDASGAIGEMPVATKIRVYSNHKQRFFGVHPGFPGTNARIDGSLANHNIGFTLAAGVWHKMYITLGCNGLHVFNVTDGIDPRKTWAKIFTLADYYTGDLSAVAVSAGHQSLGSIAGPGVGQTECYTNDGTHCFKLVVPPTALTKAGPVQLSKQSAGRAGTSKTCSSWGDVHFKSFPTVFRGINFSAGKEFDWMGIGTYELAACDEKNLEIQVFQCPARRMGVTWAVACAVRAGNHTVTVIGMDCFIDGVLVKKPNTLLTGGVSVDKDSNYVTIRGPPSGPLSDFGEVRVRLSRVEGRNPMNVAQNVYVTLPETTKFVNITGLCTDPRYEGHRRVNKTLFSKDEEALLEYKCFNLTNYSKEDPWDPEAPPPQQTCKECNNEEVTYEKAKEVCGLLGNECGQKSEQCAQDFCISCGAPDVVIQALDACSEEGDPPEEYEPEFPDIPPSDMPPEPPMTTCIAWGGGPHYTTYTNTSFDFPEVGVYNFSESAIDGFESQVYQCPYKSLNGSLKTKAAYIAAAAVKVSYHTITMKGSTVKVNATDYSIPGTYSLDGYVELEVQNGFVTIKGPPSMLGRAEFKFRSLLGPKSITVHNAYARVPTAHTYWYEGLCTTKNGTTTKTLFDPTLLAELDSECNSTNPSPPDRNLTEACKVCGGGTYISQAEASCAKVGSSSEPYYTGCLKDYCTSCQYKCSEKMASDAKKVYETNGASMGTFPDGRDSCVPPHADGDPHALNARGESFDIRAWGALTMARIPRAETLASAGLSVVAHVEPATARRCGPTYVTRVDVQGTWLGAPPVTLRVGPQGVPQVDGLENFTSVGGRRGFRKQEGNTTIMETGGKRSVHVIVKVGRYAVDVKQLVENNFKYLNLAIRGISGTIDEVGGLLGSDDHTAATQVPPECRRPQDGIAVMARDAGEVRDASELEGPYLLSTLTAE